MTLVFITTTTLLGLFVLSLLLKHPYKKLFDKKIFPKYKPYLHTLGWSLCSLSLYVTVQTYGLGIGIVYWLGFVTLLALILVLTY